jgi:hypothetical protein
MRPSWLLLCSSLAAIGCGASRDATEKELATLHAEVAKLRAQQAAMAERLDTLEIARGAFSKGAATAAPAASPPPSDPDRPDLSVVRLSPSEGDGDVDKGGPRPMIRAVGSDGSIQRGNKKTKNDKKGIRPAVKR